MRDVGSVREAFDAAFGAAGEVVGFYSPGRVNLIGDHIDYSGGLVLPMALDRGTVLLARERADTVIRGASMDRDLVVSADLSDTGFRPEHEWFSYVLGVLDVMASRGLVLRRGLDLMVAGDIPDGGGLSSSASLELAAGVAFDHFGGFGLDATELALVGQAAENDYIGVACGIMDQLAIARGEAGNALLMDCRTLDVTPVPFPHDDLTLLIVSTNHRRSLAESAYNDRRADTERAAEVLGVERLVELGPAALEAAADQLDDAAYRRARHTITEQARVVAAAAALAERDFTTLGRLMRESHESLRDDFEVTGPYLDALAEAAWAQPGTVGARMTGAGFGGCAVVLVEPGSEVAVIAGIERDYEAATGVAPWCMVVGSHDGAGPLVTDEGIVA